MAMSVTVTSMGSRNPGSVYGFKVVWVSAADGSATGVLANCYGECIRITTDPGAVAPTDNYDITLVDETGTDILGGAGADRDTANTETAYPVIDATTKTRGVPCCGNATFTVAAAGDTKGGTAWIFFRL